MLRPVLVVFSYLFVERILQIVQDLCADKPSWHFRLATSWEGFLPFTNFFNHLFFEFFSLEPVPRAAVVTLPGYPLSFLIPVLSVIVFPFSISRLRPPASGAPNARARGPWRGNS